MDSVNNLNRLSLYSILLWIAVTFLFIIFVRAVDYEFHDPDSQLYSKLGQELSEKPVSLWIAPRWVSYSGVEAYFREHPSGVIWVTAALIRIGAPKEQAAAIANFLYFLITLFFIFKIGQIIKDKITGWSMAWAAFLMPVSFLYIVRGNLEPPLTMAVVVGIYCLVRIKESWRYGIGFTLALIMAVFFKGLQGGFVGVVGALYWILAERNKRHFYILAAGAIFLMVVMGIYEWQYRQQSGEQFWLANFRIQAVVAVETNNALQKPYNLIWYLCRALYFAFPWSLVLLVGLRSFSERSRYPKDKSFIWLLLCAALFIIIMSLFDRRADRYIYPAYTFIAMAGGWYVSERFTKVQNWLIGGAMRIHISFAAAILAVAVMKVLISTYFYSNIQIWRN